jgi:hypothetical protein
LPADYQPPQSAAPQSVEELILKLSDPNLNFGHAVELQLLLEKSSAE